jgi:hypothetical protein
LLADRWTVVGRGVGQQATATVLIIRKKVAA